MRAVRTLITVAAVGGLLTLAAGCSADKKVEKAKGEDVMQIKVQAMKKLADAMAKDPNGAEVFEALEEFQNNYVDPKQHPEQAKEILDIYAKRIKGKYKGEFAQQVASAMNVFESNMKQ